jgi:hypothetical protein
VRYTLKVAGSGYFHQDPVGCAEANNALRRKQAQTARIIAAQPVFVDLNL